MNTKNTAMLNNLTEWIEEIIEAAKDDNCFSIAWFKGTENKPFSIIGGWMEGFSEDYSDLLCISKSNPKYAMCIKIAVNEGPYAYTDFEMMDMPINKEGDVDDTCIALEYNDDPKATAEFFLGEWERIMREYGEDEEI